MEKRQNNREKATLRNDAEMFELPQATKHIYLIP